MMSLDVRNDDLKAKFPKEPFAIRHTLVDHPLFTLPRLVELANALDRDRIEYSSGDVTPDQSPQDTPKVGLPIDETIRRIEECHAWMVIKNVESDPEYRALIEVCLEGVRNQAGLDDQSFHDMQGFIFISSANTTTPFHVDAEHNFLLQIRGNKFMHVFHNEDRALVPESAMEISPGKHRNQAYRPEFEERATVYELSPGDGLFLPYMWPHWVRTEDDYCISIAVTWRTARVLRENKIRFANAMLRNLGLPQPAPGQAPVLDGIKVAAYNAAHAVIEPLRKNERSRRLIRQLLFGRKANYYYES